MTALIIDKEGIISEKKFISMDKLYLLCGYRSNKNFVLLHNWNIGGKVCELYGKKTGTHNNENKYMSPINEVYYGKLCIVVQDGSITIDEWTVFYNTFENNRNTDKTYTKHIEKEYCDIPIDKELTYEPYEMEK